MKTFFRVIVFTIIFVSSEDTIAQRSKTGNWFIYFGNQAINKKWNWWNEVQYRNYNVAGDLQQLLLRTGIGVNLSDNNNNLLLGYAFVHSRNYIAGTALTKETDEHRLYQQFITRQQFGRTYMQHRYRVEQRFLAGDFQLRFRYFFALNVPINKKRMTAGAFYASAYDEIFLNAQNAIFDRNRLYAALGYVFNKNCRMEAGFMTQTLENTSRNQFQIVVFNNLALYK